MEWYKITANSLFALVNTLLNRAHFFRACLLHAARVVFYRVLFCHHHRRRRRHRCRSWYCCSCCCCRLQSHIHMNLNVNNIEQVQCKVLARAHNEERTRTRTRRLTQKSRKKYIAVFVLDARGKLKLKVCVIVYANVRVKYRATHIREKRHRTTRAGCKRAKEKKIGQKKKSTATTTQNSISFVRIKAYESQCATAFAAPFVSYTIWLKWCAWRGWTENAYTLVTDTHLAHPCSYTGTWTCFVWHQYTHKTCTANFDWLTWGNKEIFKPVYHTKQQIRKRLEKQHSRHTRKKKEIPCHLANKDSDFLVL